MEKILQLYTLENNIENGRVLTHVLSSIHKEAQRKGLVSEVLLRNTDEVSGAVTSAAILIDGEGANQFAKQWTALIKYKGRRASTTGGQKFDLWYVRIMSMVGDFRSIEIRSQDLRFSTARASGPGGQHVNKVNSAVRVLHIPSGISASDSSSRSQHQNKTKALEKLKLQIQLKRQQDLMDRLLENKNYDQESNPTEKIKVLRGRNVKNTRRSKMYKSGRQKFKQETRRIIKEE
jgi:peptide chain release factor